MCFRGDRSTLVSIVLPAAVVANPPKRISICVVGRRSISRVASVPSGTLGHHPPTEPTWHRTSRARRSRARKAVRASRSGTTVEAGRLAAAKLLLISHHGVRGSAIAVMAGQSKAFTKVEPSRHPMDWECPECSKGKPADDPFLGLGKVRHLCSCTLSQMCHHDAKEGGACW